MARQSEVKHHGVEAALANGVIDQAPIQRREGPRSEHDIRRE
jgi:hypothetical protein